MKHNAIHGTRFFFATSPLPCPYLPGRVEQRVVMELAGRDAADLHDSLSMAGFRRSHSVAYTPACPDCQACVAVRVVVDEFRPSQSQRRVMRLNSDLAARELDPVISDEQYALFTRYQGGRHSAGDMAKMDYLDYQALVEETPVDTLMVEFRDPNGVLVGACLTDRVGNGLSAVYSFFDPAQQRRSLGNFIILWLIGRAREEGLDYAYLGFWIADCAKMSYKARFQPLEGYTPDGWAPITGPDGAQNLK